MTKKLFTTPLFLIAICFSAYGQWTWLNPKPSGLTGTDVVFVNDQKGFIVNSSQLVATINGGATWEIKQAVTNAKQIRFRDSRGFIVGDYGAVYRSDDTGTTWNTVSVSSSENFHSVHILQSDTVYIVSEKKLFKSFDGGTTWSSGEIKVSEITAFKINRSFFTNTKTGHVVCDDGLILKTKDGGATWYSTLRLTTFPSDFFCITFVNDRVGFATREHNSIVKTTDGGETWKEIPNTSDAIYGMFFLNENVGYIAGEHGVIFKTEDGGATWNFAGFQNGRYDATSMYGLYFLNESTGFAVGFRGRILKTVDGGKNWQQYAFTYNDINEISFPSATTGYAFSDQIYKTTDEGNTWQTLTTGLDESQYYYPFGYFLSPEKGFVFASSSYNAGKMLMTTDGGATWTLPSAAGTSISFISSTLGFMGGYGIYKTADGGTTWQSVSSFSGREITFINETNGFGILYGDLYKTGNGGVTWGKIYEVYGDFTAIHFVNDKVGYVSAEYGVILKTTDGGNTWVELQTPYDHLHAITFLNENIGFTTGEYGGNFSTSDGGTTWQGEALPIRVKTLTITPNKKIFAGGYYGGLIRNSLTVEDFVIKAVKADSVSATSAFVSGVVALNTGTAQDITLEYGPDLVFSQSVALTPATMETGKNKRYAIKLTGLLPSTKYNFRLKMTHDTQQRTSNAIGFTTLPELQLNLYSISISKPHNAEMSGIVVSNAQDITNIVFQYDTTEAFTKSVDATPSFIKAKASSYVTAQLKDLASATKYFVRIKAKHQNKDYFSNIVSFTTLPEYMIVIRNPVITGNSVKLNANITSNEAAITNLQFGYGLRGNFDSHITPTPNGINGGTTNFATATVIVPHVDSIYHYRLTGTYNGKSISSTTSLFRASGGLILVPGPARSITTTSAVITGLYSPQGVFGYTLSFEYGPTNSYGQFAPITGYYPPNTMATFVLQTSLSDLAPGKEYHFRLKAVGDGQEFYSNDGVFKTEIVTDVTENGTTGIAMFPNPATARTVLSSSAMIKTIDVYNVIGHLIFHAEPDAFTYDLEVAPYASGLYFVHVRDREKTHVARLIRH